MITAVHPKRVRYIKLGTKGGWEKECINKASWATVSEVLMLKGFRYAERGNGTL
jgi:hypothetical protein